MHEVFVKPATIHRNSWFSTMHRALLCLVLFVALLGQNSGHIFQEAASHGANGIAHEHGAPARGDGPNHGGTPADCGDYGCHLITPVRETLVVLPPCQVLIRGLPGCGLGADVPYPDRPPRA